MKQAAILSALFHLVLILLLILGLPSIKTTPDLQLETAIPVEILTIDTITQAPNPTPLPAKHEPVEQVPPKPLPKPEPQAIFQPEPVKSAITPDTIPPIQPEIAPSFEELKAIADQLHAADKPIKIKESINEPAEKPVKLPQPEKPVVKPVVKPKPAVVEKPKDKKKDKKADTSFNSVLKNLAKLKATPDNNDFNKDTHESSDNKSSHVGVVGASLTMSEQDAVRQQITSCWSINPGAKDIDQLFITLEIWVNMDRTVRDVRVIPDPNLMHNPFYRSLSESAVRAVRDPRCSPLRLPEGKYDQWKHIEMKFRPPV